MRYEKHELNDTSWAAVVRIFDDGWVEITEEIGDMTNTVELSPVEAGALGVLLTGADASPAPTEEG